MFETVTRRLFRAGGRPATPKAPEPDDAPQRPRIGLALGGGAARGWAHIGVLQGLEAAGVDIDVVAGTSMGALAGGAYLAGHLPELEVFARSLTPRRVFGLLDPRLGGNGLISGSKLRQLLDTHLVGMCIEDLPKPFMCVATELKTGHEIWLSRGNLVEAMRASYALPGIFEPVEIDHRRLVDGALVNPVPVSTARAMGADLVIAVNVAADGPGHGTVVHAIQAGPGRRPEASEEGVAAAARDSVKKQLFRGEGDRPGLTGVMIDAYNIIQDRITRSRLAGDPPDVVIAPKVAKLGLFDFHRAEEAIAAGREAAARAVAEIRERADDLVLT